VLTDDPEDLDPGLAKERTRLAWVRTAVAFAAVGAAMLRLNLAAGLIVLAITPLIWALGLFASHQALPDLRSKRLLLVALAVAIVSALAAAVAFLGHSPASLHQLLPLHG
jgi:uncharacterized membrane protein YidH (DUF202 family)